MQTLAAAHPSPAPLFLTQNLHFDKVPRSSELVHEMIQPEVQMHLSTPPLLGEEAGLTERLGEEQAAPRRGKCSPKRHFKIMSV